MEKHLFIAGHGQGPTYFDPGAHGNGTNESEFLREVFFPILKQYSPPNVDFYVEDNFYAHKKAQNLTGYDQVTEFHLDSASPQADGGHVIIYKAYNPDKVDLAIRDTINGIVGLRMSGGISKRDDLYNLNVFAKRGITYRLIELGFITNESDMNKIKNNLHEYAKRLIESITGEKVDSGGGSSELEKADRFAHEAQEWVMNQGISDGSRPRDPVTRQELWVMLHRNSK